MGTNSQVCCTSVEWFLLEYCDAVSASVSGVNRGGCGIFTETLMMLIDDMGLRDNSFIRVLNIDDNAPAINVADVENSFDAPPRHAFHWNSWGVDFWHIVVELWGEYWDVDGPDAYSRYNDSWGCHLHDGNMSLKALKEINKCPQNWNRSFRRVPNINRIRAIYRRFSKRAKEMNFYVSDSMDMRLAA